MTTWFVSRHAGAVEWADQHGLTIDRVRAHLRIEEIEPTDIVVGTLPIDMVAVLCSIGARYFHLTLSVPADFRGQELTAEQLVACNARLHEFRVELLSSGKL
jgi:CRISPR-associated protein Csx16